MKSITILALDLGTQTGWALTSSDGLITSGSESFKPQRFEGGGMRYLQIQALAHRSQTVCRWHRYRVLRGSAPPCRRGCGSRIRRLPGYAHRLVRASQHSVPGCAGRHDQKICNRQGQCEQGANDRGHSSTWSHSGRRQRSRCPGTAALGN